MVIIIIVLFLAIIAYDVRGFIRKKEQASVIIIYLVLMGISLVVSVLLASGIKPSSPAQWIETALKMVGVVK
ncbi:MAG TPA: hypothetical protein PLD49_07355 [Thermoclostridium caenicola]|nr:hypothetical protein [Thermoclostridium caenicola]HOL85504.1 hypothetical protein [Thermoclostridium caenicola]